MDNWHKKCNKILFEKLMVNYHELNINEMALHSMGPFSLCHCGYPDPFGAGFREKIPHWLSIMAEGGHCSSH